MSIETDLVALVSPMLAGGLWADTADAGTTLPYATYQQVGGQTVNPINGADPHLYHARIQINVWAATRKLANEKMRAIELALRANPLAGRPIGALRAEFNEVTGARGAMQDFEVWWNT